MRSLSIVFALAALTACGGPPQAVVSQDARPQLGDDWFAYRAETLGITPADARARDAALPGVEGPPPEGALDDVTAREAAALWRAQCSACHGVEGEPPPAIADRYAAADQNPPRSWGGMAAMGFLMGGDSMRTKIYARIAEGVPPNMPAWGGALSREQMWALVRHIEGF